MRLLYVVISQVRIMSDHFTSTRYKLHWIFLVRTFGEPLPHSTQRMVPLQDQPQFPQN